MKRCTILTLIPFSFLVFIPPGAAFQSWEKPPQPPVRELAAVLEHPLDGSTLIVASRHQIYQGLRDSSWDPLWQLDGAAREIRRIVSFKEIPDAVFILTREGAFRGNLKTKKWNEIYNGKNPSEKSALAFALLPEDPDHWFIGTQNGLYESDDAGKVWFRFDRFSERKPVSVVRFVGGRLFIATRDQLFVSDDLTHFRPVFSIASLDHGEALIPLSETSDAFPEELSEEIVSSENIYELISSGDACEFLWLATRKGVFESRDCGQKWVLLSTSGLKNVEIRQLAFSQKLNKLFAAASGGIYIYHAGKNRWEELFQGTIAAGIRGLAVLEGEKSWLFAATSEGLMQYPILPEDISAQSMWISSPQNLNLFQELIRLEPSARDLHKAVIRYGNLSNWKIKRWHAESRLSSLLPTFSAGKDFSRANNIDLDRAGALEPDLFIHGPDDTREAWDMSVNWDLGDFIWSSSQTSIDSRDKLMVELRNDFLAEATRIYYERRRLQMEIVFTPVFSEREHFEKIIRLDELTSLLDGMTDGLFSRRLSAIYAQKPELGRLWEYSNSKSETLNKS